MKNNELYFFTDGNKHMVEVIGKEISCEISQGMYEETQKQFQPFFDTLGDRYFVVDNNWAGGIVMMYNEIIGKKDEN